MRALLLLACALAAGCSLVLDPSRHQGGSGADAGPDSSTGGPCSTAADCTGNAPVCHDGACLDCDGDGDGAHLGDAACDELRGGSPVDCDDARGDVHPGAPPVCGDGVVNGCDALPTDLATTLGLGELAVSDTITQLFVSEPGGSIEPPTLVALQSAGGEPNAAVAARVYDASGTPRAYLFPFDHTAPAASTPIEPAPSSGVFDQISHVDLWPTSSTTATVLVNGTVVGGTQSALFFGSVGPGIGAPTLARVEPDRTTCRYYEVRRRSWSARRDWWAFIAMQTDPTGGPDVYSLHAVGPGGAIACIPDLSALGIAATADALLFAAGDVVLFKGSGGDDTYVWKPGTGIDPERYVPGTIGEGPILAMGEYDYLMVSAEVGLTRVDHLDCNTRTGCALLASNTIPSAPGPGRGLVRWGAGAAVLTVVRDEPVDGSDMLAEGVEVRFVGAEGDLAGGEAFTARPFERRHDPATFASIRWLAATAIPRLPGSAESDFLVAFVRAHPDSTESIELARIDGCVDP